MFNVRPDALSPWLYVEAPPADEVPGFRVNPDDSVRDTPSAAPPWSFGFDPSAGSSSSMGPGLQDAMRFAPGNVYPDTYLTGLSGFAPPPRHPLQDALDQIMRLYAPLAPRSSNPFESQGLATSIVSPNVSRPLSSYAPALQSRVTSDGAPTVGPLGSFSSDLASLETETTFPQVPEGLPAPDDQRGLPPWLQVNLPSQPESAPPFGRMSSDAEPMSLPMPTTGAGNPPATFDDGTGVGTTLASDAQIAQAPRPQPQTQKPAPNPKKRESDPSASEQELQVNANTQLVRASVWNDLIRKPPEKIDPRFQQPLPDDWETAVVKINPNYLKWTKAAAQKHGIPPELLSRLSTRSPTLTKASRAAQVRKASASSRGSRSKLWV